MKAKKRLEIFWETHESTTISFNRNVPARAFCQTCRADAPHLSLGEAAALLHASEREIFRMIQTGEFHYSETAAGALLVCVSSFEPARKDQKGD